MAVLLNASGENLRQASNPTGASTWCGWVNRAGTGAAAGFEGICRWGGANGTLANADAIYYVPATPGFEIWSGTDAAARFSYGFTMTTDTWYFLALTDASGAAGAALEFFLGTEAVPVTSRASGTRGGGALSNVQYMIGEAFNSAGSDWFNGRFFNCQLHDRQLTVQELVAIQLTMMPPAIYRPWAHQRLWVVSEYEDISGNGRDLTLTGGTASTYGINPALQIGRWLARSGNAGAGAPPTANNQLAWIAG